MVCGGEIPHYPEYFEMKRTGIGNAHELEWDARGELIGEARKRQPHLVRGKVVVVRQGWWRSGWTEEIGNRISTPCSSCHDVWWALGER